MNIFYTKYRLQKAIISSVLIGFILSIILITFTLHPHQTTDGKFVVHSHALPIKSDDSNGNNHTHSELEFSLSSIFTSNLAAVFFIVSFLVSLIKSIPFYQQIEEAFRSTLFNFNFTLRGPPILK